MRKNSKSKESKIKDNVDEQMAMIVATDSLRQEGNIRWALNKNN